MDEDTKRDCDVTKQLEEGCWRRITERRSYEWRAAYTLWSAVGAFIAIVITKTELFKQLDVPVLLGVAFIGIVFCVIHWYWLEGLGKAHADDADRAVHYGGILRRLSNSAFDKEQEARFKDRLEATKKRLVFGDWSRRCQLFVTMVLWLVAIWAVWAIGN